MMDQLINRFPEQLAEALSIGENAKITLPVNPIHKIFAAGMGGSGIGANFVAEFVRDECPVPYIVGKAYVIPKYVDKNTLAIASSYSGNTEETLQSFEQMEKSGAKIICIASGGKLIERAKAGGHDFIQLPGGWPSPRACLGFSLTQQVFILHKLGLISDEKIQHIRSAKFLLEKEQSSIKTLAKDVAAQLNAKMPVIYTTDRMESVAIRLRQQLNENSKILCWHHVVPEMNHNELVGWKDERKDIAVIYLRNEDDYKRNQVRIDINKKIITKLNASIIELHSKGNSLIEQSLYLVHLSDWISWYLSEIRGVDAVEIDVIDFLKSELAKV